MSNLGNRLREALTSVDRSYDDFINSFCDELEDYPDKQKEVIKYIEEHPGVRSDKMIDVIMEEIAPELYAENDDDDYDEEVDE